MRRCLVLLYCCVAWNLSAAEDRIWVDLTINKDQSVHLVFDTGATVSALFRSTAERLKLKLAHLPAEALPASGLATNPVTEMCDFARGPVTGRMRFLVLTLLPFTQTEAEGLLSWCAFRSNVFVFASTDRFTRFDLTNTVPPQAFGWPKYPQRTDWDTLGFEVGGKDGPRQTVEVDTGDPGGVALEHTLWEKWVATRAQQPATMMITESPQAGVLVKKVLWADQISIGSLTLMNVPVRELDPKEALPNHVATLGMYALRRLDFVLDGKNGIVYARARTDVARPFRHNHLGAVFDPGNSTNGTFVARVAPGSPADLAGIRDNDVLLKVDDRAVAQRHAAPRVSPRDDWEASPGTKYRLTLRRGEREYETTVTLKCILGPAGLPGPLTLAEIRSEAEKGDAQAQTELGRIYFLGQRGVAVDKAEGVKWFRRAAEQNYAEAQFIFGLCCEKGEGVAKDAVEAAKWHRQAAEQNHADAQNSLGNCYAGGFGVTKDEAEAIKWYRRAAEQNYAGAQFNLAGCYAQGVGVAKDTVEALKWVRKAAEQDFAPAQVNLAGFYDRGEGVPQDYAEALRWIRKAAEHNYPQAQSDLAYHYVNGLGVKKDAVEGVIWFRKAALQNNAAAQAGLAACYALGIGAPKDLVEACAWDLLAAAQGNAKADRDLSRLTRQMTQEQIAEAQRRARVFQPVSPPPLH